jgi:hypothetical protein
MRAAALLATTLAVGLSTAALAQGPPIPQPGPEHEILKRDVGVWDVTLDITPGPGMPTFTMLGEETNNLFAGRWIHSEFKLDMMGQAYEGHGLSGYDPEKKVYVAVMADTMGTSLTHSEATYDAATNTMTGSSEAQDPMGGKTKSKTVTQWPDADTRIVKMFLPAESPEPFMVMTYKRRKPAAPAAPAAPPAPATPPATKG